MSDTYLAWVQRWLEAPRLPTAVRKHRALVYQLVKREWPAIAAGERVASDDRFQVGRIAELLREKAKKDHPKNPRVGEQWVATFAAMLDCGYKLGLWAIVLPAFAIRIARPRSPFSPGSVALLRQARAIEEALLKSLENGGKFDKAVNTDQIFCSSILLGGLLSWKRLIRLAHVRVEYLRHDAGMVWTDFPVYQDSEDDAQQLSQTPDEHVSVSRWFLDPISALLLLRRVRESRPEAGARLIDVNPVTREAVITRIRSFLADHGCPAGLIPKSLKEMFDCGAMRLFAYSMGVVVAYAKGQVESSSPTAAAWARMRSGLVLDRQKPPAQAAAVPPPGTSSSQPALTELSGAAVNARHEQLLERLLNVIGKLSKKKRIRRKMLAKAIQPGIEKGIGPQSALGCLLSWCGDLIEGRQAKLSSIHRYLTAYAKQLVRHAGMLDFGKASEGELIALYEHVLRTTKPSQRSYVSGCLAQFHHHLVRTHGTVDVDFADVDGFDCAETVISANLLTPSEFDACSQVLTPSGNPDAKYGRRRWVSYVALIIGYRAGLRTAEICELRLADLNFDGMPELTVCRGSLKSTRAKRTIPFGLSLNGQEYRMLRRWWQQRLNESRGNMHAPLLAIDPAADAPLSEDEIRIPVQEAMRRVTGDDTLTFKHLRHSFGSWLFLMLVADEIPEALAADVKAFMHAEFSTRLRMRLKRYFFPLGNASGGRHHTVRPALFQVAHLLGHSGPGVSLKHYLHLMDYFLGREVYDIAPRLTVKQAAVLLDVTPARVYQICEGRLRDGQLHPGVLVAEAARRAGIGPEHFRSLMVAHDTSKVRISSIEDLSAYACGVILTLAEAHAASLCKDNKLALDLTDVLEKFSVSSDDLNLWHKAACKLSDRYRTRNQVPRHDLVSRIPSGWDERVEAAQLMDALMLSVRTKKGAWTVYRNVGRFLRTGITRREVVFRTPETARSYMRFLRGLGLPDGRIVFLHLRKKGADAGKTLRDRRWWGRQVGFPADRICPRDAEANRVIGKHGWIAVSVQSTGFVSGRSRRKGGPAKARRQSSQAFHCALHLFAIWGEMQRLIRRNVAARAPASLGNDPTAERVRF